MVNSVKYVLSCYVFGYADRRIRGDYSLPINLDFPVNFPNITPKCPNINGNYPNLPENSRFAALFA